jgi:hypothetical protein
MWCPFLCDNRRGKMYYLLLLMLISLLVINNSLMIKTIIDLKENWYHYNWLLKILGIIPIISTSAWNLYLIIILMR